MECKIIEIELSKPAAIKALIPQFQQYIAAIEETR
jgi:hypothetical protein